MNPFDVELARKWRFENYVPMPGGHCSRVYANDDLVLKIPFQGEEQSSGALAAVGLSGSLGPRVFEFDVESGSLLMERVVPGTPLHLFGLTDKECRAIMIGLVAQIRELDSNQMFSVSSFVDMMSPIAKSLVTSTTSRVFLHGDLHHENILYGRNGWTVIDPKGLVGDPAFEYSAYMRNPIEELSHTGNLEDLLRRRLSALEEETGYSASRIWGWSVLALGSCEGDTMWAPISDALWRLEGEFSP